MNDVPSEETSREGKEKNRTQPVGAVGECKKKGVEGSKAWAGSRKNANSGVLFSTGPRREREKGARDAVEKVRGGQIGTEGKGTPMNDRGSEL